MRIKRWKLAEQDDDKIIAISKELGLPTTVCKVLCARYPESTVEEIKNTITKDITFESPYNLKDMDKAVERITKAIEEDEKIVIYGDYDCDGITSTALLLAYFSSLGIEADFYIPGRSDEGYGMNVAAINRLKKAGTNLIITVDNGISSHSEISYAGSLGIDVVVTDHHSPRETMPDAVAVVNPHRPDCPSRFKDYAGVGVAYQLVCALDEADPADLLPVYGDLVAIGTIADLVSLKDENKEIINKGIEAINLSARPGVEALIEISGLNKPITSEEVAFGISPRINAAGRVGDVKKAVELLITEDYEKALEIAGSLSGFNTERRGVEEEVLKEIRQYIRENSQLLYERMLIISGKEWHQGVMGIVASRLVDLYGKPTIVFSESEGILKGSGRSVEGFSLIEAINACSENLTHYGGHTLAAGLTLSEEHLESFTEEILDYAKKQYKIMPVLTYSLDAKLDISDLTIENIKSLSVLSPFGAGNPSPIFTIEKATLVGIYPTADEKHMRLKFKKDNEEFTTIYFRMSPDRFSYNEGDLLDMVIDVDINQWNGAEQLSIKIKDLRTSDYPQEQSILSSQQYEAYKRGEENTYNKADLLPSRNEQEFIYRFLRQYKIFPYDRLAMWEKTFKNISQLGKLLVALDIFSESGLIKLEDGVYSLEAQQGKTDITKTSTYETLV